MSAVTFARHDWSARAACAQSDVGDITWFPEVPTRGDDVDARRYALETQAAVLVCRQCPVETDCRQYALAHQIQHGIWGGLTEQELRRGTGGRSRQPALPPDHDGVSYAAIRKRAQRAREKAAG